MKRYAMDVIETRLVRVRYVVLADSKGDAVDKGLSGETDSEQVDDLVEVLERSLPLGFKVVELPDELRTRVTLGKIEWDITLHAAGRYENGRLAIRARCDDGEPFGAVTTNIPTVPLEDGCFLLRSDIDQWPLKAVSAFPEVFEDTGKTTGPEFQYRPIWRLLKPIE